jgi:hypothetical protein
VVYRISLVTTIGCYTPPFPHPSKFIHRFLAVVYICCFPTRLQIRMFQLGPHSKRSPSSS